MLIERQFLDSGAVNAATGLRGHVRMGSLYAYPGTPAMVETLRDALGEEAIWGVTLLDGLIVCRALAQRMDELRLLFGRIWALLRQEIMGRPALAPRIWST